jgi:hypothetical protein
MTSNRIFQIWFHEDFDSFSGSTYVNHICIPSLYENITMLNEPELLTAPE